MERNLDRRVEVLCPVRDPAMSAHILDVVLHAYFVRQRPRLCAEDDRYRPVPSPDNQPRVSAQQVLLESSGSIPQDRDDTRPLD